MSTPQKTTWSPQPHTRAKHAILKCYLEAWFPILGKDHRQVNYIDGFAGPGRYNNDDPGSPIIAIETALNLSRETQIRFWFIDERPDRIEQLEREVGKISLPSNFTVKTEAGNFSDKFRGFLDDLDTTGRDPGPTFAFIDPFGFKNIPLKQIGRLLSHQRCEVLVTFMVDAINRWLEHPNQKITEHIVDAFDSKEAISFAQGGGIRVSKLRECYQDQLKRFAKYVRFFEMRDAEDRIQFYLFFASNNLLGLIKMKEAMWKVDPSGEFRFSDHTDPNQLILFEQDPTLVLADQLHRYFGAVDKFLIKDICTYVDEETPYLRRHLNSAFRELERAGQLTIYALKRDGSPRRKGSYPEDAMVLFQGEGQAGLF